MSKVGLAVEIDKAELDSVRAAMYGIRNGYKKVLVRSVNKTMTGVKKDAAKEIANVLNLTQKRIKEDFYIRKMTWARLHAAIVSTGKPLPLHEFKGTEPREKGVTVKVLTKGKRSIIPQAFMSPGKGGKKLIVGRRRYKGPRTNASRYLPWARISPSKTTGFRYPVKWLTGPRIQDIYDTPKVRMAVMDKLEKRLSKNLDHEVTYLLSKV